MKGWINRWKEELKDEWKDEQKKGWITGRMNEWVNECLLSPAAQTNPSYLSPQTLKSIIYRHSDRHLYIHTCTSLGTQRWLSNS